MLEAKQLEELHWMLKSHIHGKACGSNATLTDQQIVCHRCSDGERVDWTHGLVEVDDNDPVPKRARTSKTNLVEDVEPLLKEMTYEELTELNFKLASEFFNRSRLLE